MVSLHETNQVVTPQKTRFFKEEVRGVGKITDFHGYSTPSLANIYTTLFLTHTVIKTLSMETT